MMYADCPVCGNETGFDGHKRYGRCTMCKSKFAVVRKKHRFELEDEHIFNHNNIPETNNRSKYSWMDNSSPR